MSDDIDYLEVPPMLLALERTFHAIGIDSTFIEHTGGNVYVLALPLDTRANRKVWIGADSAVDDAPSVCVHDESSGDGDNITAPPHVRAGNLLDVARWIATTFPDVQ